MVGDASIEASQLNPSRILKQMEQSTGAPESQNLIDPDLEPLYELSEGEYQAVINQLTNVLIDTIGQLCATSNADEARFVAEQAYDVLLDYDEDVAEHVRWLVREDESKEAKSTEELDW